MMQQIREADWKVFRRLRVVALGRAFERATGKMGELLAGEGRTHQERFWDVMEYGKEQQGELADMFDGERRSRALMQLGMMAGRGLLTEEEMGEFSEETRRFVQGVLDLRRL